MAIITRRAGAFDEERVRFEYDYDDGTFYVVAVRCINQTALPAYGWVSIVDSGRVYERSFAANTTTSQSIPTGQANRLELVMSGRGIENIDLRLRWPE